MPIDPALNEILSAALRLVFFIITPVAAAALAAGLITGALQALTRLEEPIVGFIARLLAVSAVLALLGGWMSENVIRFTVEMWSSL